MYRTNRTLMSRYLRDGGPGADPASGAGAGGGGGQAGQGQSSDGPAGNGEEQLGDAGKQALDRERAAAREAGRLKTAAEQKAAELEAELTKLREATQSDAEKATAKAVKEATEQVAVAANQRLVRAEVKAAAAAAQFHDPHDAALLLSDKFGQVKVDKDGNVDDAAVKQLVEDLAKSKPHLVKTAGGDGKGPKLGGQGGGNSSTPAGKAAGLAAAQKRFPEKYKTTS